MPPVVIAAGIGAAGAIGGSLLSGGAQKSAAAKATEATTNAQNTATAAQLQLGQQSLDMQRQMYNNNTGLQTDIYNQDFNMLSPYATNGVPASNAINAMLGLGYTPPTQSTVHAPPPIPSQTLTPTGAPGTPGLPTTPAVPGAPGTPPTYPPSYGPPGSYNRFQ